ncbi:hypothetical protein [Streptomyces sp. NPDC057257]|uniref:hypothetical protein n=1 Tax=Streptomyces sp. NPDC057257 TaxID=3346071 RepID=UPI003630D630
MTDRSTGTRCGNDPNIRLTDGDRKAVEDFKARLALKEAAKPYIERAAWADFDPLMEVIAATVWEHCARDDAEMPQLVRDDPRTIAAFAAAVARAHAAGMAPATDQTEPSRRAGLRDQLVDALWQANGPSAAEEANVDAVLAVLYREWPWLRAAAEDTATQPAAVPAVDRAAVLLEVADWLKAWRPEFFERWAVTEQDRYESGVDDATAELRRMAGEAQQQPDTETLRPVRGDQFEAWLKRFRDASTTWTEWHTFDAALDRYRLHADTGTPLSEHVCEGRMVGDCECLEPSAAAGTGEGQQP